LPSDIFHCQISQIWRFSKAFGSENDRLAKMVKSIWQPCFATSSKNLKIGCMGDFKAFNGKMVSRTKTSGERAHR